LPESSDDVNILPGFQEHMTLQGSWDLGRSLPAKTDGTSDRATTVLVEPGRQRTGSGFRLKKFDLSFRHDYFDSHPYRRGFAPPRAGGQVDPDMGSNAEENPSCRIGN